MVHLAQQNLMLLTLVTVGDVAGDLRRADDGAVRRPDRRHRQRDVDQAAVLALANRVVVVDGLAAADAGADYVFFVVAVGGNQDRHRLPDLFLGGIAEEPLRAAVPAWGDSSEKSRGGRAWG